MVPVPGSFCKGDLITFININCNIYHADNDDKNSFLVIDLHAHLIYFEFSSWP